MFGRWNKFFEKLAGKLEKSSLKNKLTDRQKFEELKAIRQFYDDTPDCWYCSRKWNCKNSCSNLGHDSKICDDFKY